jgi:hypothetical protein
VPQGSLRGEALDARGLAHFLKPYDIKPEKIRDGKIPSGATGAYGLRMSGSGIVLYPQKNGTSGTRKPT